MSEDKINLIKVISDLVFRIEKAISEKTILVIENDLTELDENIRIFINNYDSEEVCNEWQNIKEMLRHCLINLEETKHLVRDKLIINNLHSTAQLLYMKNIN